MRDERSFTTMKITNSAFFKSYNAARAGFLEAAGAAGARIQSHRHPWAQGPDGGPIHIDVAAFGGDRPSKVLLVISGTHGLEVSPALPRKSPSPNRAC